MCRVVLHLLQITDERVICHLKILSHARLLRVPLNNKENLKKCNRWDTTECMDSDFTKL